MRIFDDHRLGEHPGYLVSDFRECEAKDEQNDEAQHERLSLPGALEPAPQHAHQPAAEEGKPQHEHRCLGQFDQEPVRRDVGGECQGD